MHQRAKHWTYNLCQRTKPGSQEHYIELKISRISLNLTVIPIFQKTEVRSNPFSKFSMIFSDYTGSQHEADVHL